MIQGKVQLQGNRGQLSTPYMWVAHGDFTYKYNLNREKDGEDNDRLYLEWRLNFIITAEKSC